MADTVDVIVIGGGPAGEVAAGCLADAGLVVALVELELVGGECSYWGCIPSKTLIRPGAVLAGARRVPGAAAAVTGRVDVAAAFGQRDRMTSDWHDDGQLKWLREKDIALVRGAGRLTSERQVMVEGPGRQRVNLSARRAVILATGTAAAIPPVEGLRELEPWDNRDITSAHHLPGRLLVLGGGAVGVEMAQAYRRLGSAEVTVVEAGDRLLWHEEPFAGEQVRSGLEADGVRVITGTTVASAQRRANRPGAAGRRASRRPGPGRHGGAPVVLRLADGRELEGDELLVATGRRPRTEDLGLDQVGLGDQVGKFVPVDEHLRVVGVSGGWLFAVGDCNGRALLTHMGKYQARIAAEVILGRDVVDVADPMGVPRVTFTDPQVAAVGLTEAQAQEQGLRYRVVSTPTGGVAGAYVQGNGIVGISQLVIDDARQVIVGATFTGPDVQELLHSATVALVGEVPLERLRHAVPSFPTVSEVWLHVLDACGS